MIELKVNGDNCIIAKRGKMKELSEDYIKGIICIIETFSGDTKIQRGDCLEFFYRSIRDIYENEKKYYSGGVILWS